MNPATRLAALGQSLWLDNITRPLLDEGTLERYIADMAEQVKDMDAEVVARFSVG